MIRAMIYKDILENKGFLTWWFFLIILFSAIFVPINEITILLAVTPLCCINLILQIIGENDQSGWFSYLLTTSADRKMILNSLYLISVIGTGLIILISLICFSVTAFFYNIPAIEIINENAILIIWEYCYTTIINSISIFISFKINTKTARTVITLTFLLSFMLLPILFTISANLSNYLTPDFLFIIVPVIFAVIVEFLFYKVTLDLLNKKDF